MPKGLPDQFDRSRLHLKPLSQRQHDLDLSVLLPLEQTAGSRNLKPKFTPMANAIANAVSADAAVVLMMGAHVIRSGVQRFIIDMMEKGFISCVALNGAGMIHDYEFALIGATTEDVGKYIREGQFGLWEETGRINDLINDGHTQGLGMGEAVGKAIHEEPLPHADISLLAAGYRLGIPVTVHVGIGCDILHEHPNCDGAALGATSYRDFLRYASLIEKLQGGVVMNFGSAVMAPEVYLKALSMARNVAHREKRSITDFTTLVCDLHDIPEDVMVEPPRGTAAYYFRPHKTMLVRTVVDGGKSCYVRGMHADTIPALWASVQEVRG